MATKFLVQTSTPGIYQEVEAIVTSAGSADSGKVGGLGPDGRWSITMMPLGIGAPTATAIAYESLGAGDMVHLYYNAGVLTVRKALGADVSKLACGYVKEVFALGESALVYTDGQNDAIPKGTFTEADVDKEICLSATVAGGVSLTVPTATGSAVQPLGKIVGVGATTIVVKFEPKMVTIRA
jgi:hypothetical protein